VEVFGGVLKRVLLLHDKRTGRCTGQRGHDHDIVVRPFLVRALIALIIARGQFSSPATSRSSVVACRLLLVV
jgi:hypothetical protein